MTGPKALAERMREQIDAQIEETTIAQLLRMANIERATRAGLYGTKVTGTALTARQQRAVRWNAG